MAFYVHVIQYSKGVYVQNFTSITYSQFKISFSLSHLLIYLWRCLVFSHKQDKNFLEGT